MKASILLPCALLFALCSNCSETSSDALCIAPLKGRIVSKGPACAGIAVQILSVDFDAARVDSMWHDEFSSDAAYYKNTFTTFPYANENATIDEELLELIDTQESFFFVFTNPEPGFLTSNNVVMCKPLVSLPRARNEIKIVPENCNDVIVIE
jgi:hypothetical protein